MTWFKPLVAAAFVLLAGPNLALAQAQPNVATGQNGDFIATLALLPMSAEAFRLQWEMHRRSPLDLPTLHNVAVGQRLTAVVFAQNMRLTEGRILIECHMDFVLPDETRQTVKQEPCIDTEFTDPVTETYAFLYFDFDVPAFLVSTGLRLEADVTDANAMALVPLSLALEVTPVDDPVTEDPALEAPVTEADQ